MENDFLTLTGENIAREHICCAFSDAKCKEGYALKKAWLAKELGNGYVFRRLDERAKVFIEYGPAETAWQPVEAPGYLMVNCFWVAGQYKGRGYGKALLQTALHDAASQRKHGLVTVAGTAKLPFMSDTKWLLRQGFEPVEKLAAGFSLLVKKINPSAPSPAFKPCVAACECPDKEGLVAYYTNRCPFTEYYVRTNLTAVAYGKGIPLKIIRLETCREAQAAPTPATVFTLFYNGRLVTTDLGVCTEKRFDKWVSPYLG